MDALQMSCLPADEAYGLLLLLANDFFFFLALVLVFPHYSPRGRRQTQVCPKVCLGGQAVGVVELGWAPSGGPQL